MKRNSRICKCKNNKELDLSTKGLDLYISRCDVCPKRTTCIIYPELLVSKKLSDIDGQFLGSLQGTLESYRAKSKRNYLSLVKHGFKLVVKNTSLSKQMRYSNGRK